MTEQPKSLDLQFPVDANVHVINGTDIYKNNKWWCAVLKVNMFGHDKVMVYLWQYKEDKKNVGGQWVGAGTYRWRVQQKMGINFEQNWADIKKAVDQYLLEIRTA